MFPCLARDKFCAYNLDIILTLSPAREKFKSAPNIFNQLEYICRIKKKRLVETLLKTNNKLSFMKPCIHGSILVRGKRLTKIFENEFEADPMVNQKVATFPTDFHSRV